MDAASSSRCMASRPRRPRCVTLSALAPPSPATRIGQRGLEDREAEGLVERGKEIDGCGVELALHGLAAETAEVRDVVGARAAVAGDADRPADILRGRDD